MSRIVLKKDLDNDTVQSVNERLEYRFILSGLYGKVGDWIISNEGDLVFMGSAVPGCYSIYSQQLEQQDWDMHLSTKSWYKEGRSDFLCAYEKAKSLKDKDNTMNNKENSIQRFWEILKDADDLIKGILPEPRTSDEERINEFIHRLYDKVEEGKNLWERMKQVK